MKHNYRSVYLTQPLLCFQCSTYIWSISGKRAFRCTECKLTGLCFHLLFAESLAVHNKCVVLALLQLNCGTIDMELVQEDKFHVFEKAKKREICFRVFRLTLQGAPNISPCIACSGCVSSKRDMHCTGCDVQIHRKCAETEKSQCERSSSGRGHVTEALHKHFEESVSVRIHMVNESLQRLTLEGLGLFFFFFFGFVLR
jgi:hypothetical protein